jgi:inner membrane transporter RhtA
MMPVRKVPELKRAEGFRSSFTAPLLVVAVAFSFQSGSALATRLIASVGIVEALWFRTAFAAAILVLVRPRSLRLPTSGHRLPVVLLTLSLFAMNLSFYGAISNAPLGVVVAVEFLGPLAVAVLGSRRPLDFVWVVLAAAGVVLLAGPTSSVSALGLGLSLVAACCWGTFISLAKRAVTHAEPLSITTLMLVGSAMLLTPLLAVSGPRSLDQPSVLALGVTVALLSALPYLVELFIIRRLRASTYGVLLSLEPAVAAVTGFVIASQRLSPFEIVAIVAVMIAAAGASWTSGEVPAEVPPEVLADVLGEEHPDGGT